MLIWKSSDFHFIVEDAPIVNGEMISDQACISDKNMIHVLTEKGFGEMDEEKLFLKSFESLYLLYVNRLVLTKNKKQMDFNSFQVVFALIKAVVFGFLVAAISSYKGYFTSGGALEVGQSSTKAVTSSCIAILAADYLLAYLLAPLLTP